MKVNESTRRSIARWIAGWGMALLVTYLWFVTDWSGRERSVFSLIFGAVVLYFVLIAVLETTLFLIDYLCEHLGIYRSVEQLGIYRGCKRLVDWLGGRLASRRPRTRDASQVERSRRFSIALRIVRIALGWGLAIGFIYASFRLQRNDPSFLRMGTFGRVMRVGAAAFGLFALFVFPVFCLIYYLIDYICEHLGIYRAYNWLRTPRIRDVSEVDQLSIEEWFELSYDQQIDSVRLVFRRKYPEIRLRDDWARVVVDATWGQLRQWQRAKGTDLTPVSSAILIAAVQVYQYVVANKAKRGELTLGDEMPSGGTAELPRCLDCGAVVGDGISYCCECRAKSAIDGPST